MRRFCLIIAASLLVLSGPSRAPAQTVAPGGQSLDPHPICVMIRSAAGANALPVDFFTRLIWQESRFRPDVIGPMTRTGEHALGIAQFMPGTALEHSLFEPFNPAEALPKSGEFLAELRDQFGNLGLASAAYNAGPQRVRDFLIGLRDLPLETRNYVLAITGRPVEDWVMLAKTGNNGPRSEPQADLGTISCETIALLNQAPSVFTAEELSKVPRWCGFLHHPNASECGPVHEWQMTGRSSLAQLRSQSAVLRHRRADTPQAPHVTGSLGISKQ